MIDWLVLWFVFSTFVGLFYPDRIHKMQKENPVYDTKLQLVVSLQFWISWEYGVPFHYHHSQVNLAWSGSIC